jgi:hypothetical protein
MKKAKFLAVVALAAGAVVSTSALAWHHHHRGGPRVVLGFNFGYPAYYPAPYYYPAYYPPAYYPPVVVQQAPTTYVERAEPAPQASAPASNYWHYCQDSRAYYPYVKECPGGWQRVSPSPQ